MKISGKYVLPWTVDIRYCMSGLCRGTGGTQAELTCKRVFNETIKLGGGVVVEMDQCHL